MPTKLIRYPDYLLYFERQNSTSTLWLEYNQNKLVANGTQLSAYVDADGDPVVEIKSKIKNLVLRLTEGKMYYIPAKSEIKTNRIVPGYWGLSPKKDGNK